MVAIIESFHPFIALLFVGGKVDDRCPYLIVVVRVVGEGVGSDGESSMCCVSSIDREAVRIIRTDGVGGIQVVGIFA